MSDETSPPTEVEPEQLFYIECKQHGRFTVPKRVVKDWGDEIAKLKNGKRYITAECPNCGSTKTATPVDPSLPPIT